MFRKKLLVIVMALALIVPGTSNYILQPQAATNSNLVYHDFESGIHGWGARGIEEEIVSLSTEEAYSGLSSIKVSNRTATWHGATCDMTSELTLGKTYDFSIRIKYTGNSYPSTQRFSLQLQYSDGVSDNYNTIKTASVNKGQWTLLNGEYTIPTDATNVFIYVETEYKTSPSDGDLLDFYIDDFRANTAVLPEIEYDIASLRDVYSSYFDIGAATTASELAPEPAKELILKHYDNITFGNELKPDAVLDHNATIAYMEGNGGTQTNPQVSLRAARTLLEFAKANNIPVRGHTLVWHSQTPAWFFRVNYSTDSNAAWASKEVMLQRMENYIKNLMTMIKTNYPTVEFYAWDVVNEAVDPNTSTGLRRPGSSTSSGESLWMQTVGADFIVKAFEYARAYAPAGCKLFYNDYNEYETVKGDYIYNILKNLKDKNLVDGMGMQSHWTMDYPSVSMFETYARKYSTLGIEVQLTEVDMKQPDNSTNALSAQAARYKLFMSKAVALKKEGVNITKVIFWGVTDATSWLGGYPLLFDGNYKAKPAYYSIIEGIVPITVTPTPIVTVTPTPTPVVTVTPTPTPIVTVTPTPTPVVTVTPTPVVTVTPIPVEGVKPVVTVTTNHNGNSIGQQYNVTAEGGTIDLSKVSIKFTANGMSTATHNVYCDHAALQLNSAPYYTSLNGSVTGEVSEQSLVLSISSTTRLAPGEGKLSIDIRFAKTDWSTYDTLTNPVVQVYYDGVLVQ